MATAIAYETVKRWFAKTADNAASQGKSDSAALWRDGLEHLESMRVERDAALRALGLAYDVMRGAATSKKQLETALKAAQKVLRELELM